MTAPMPLEDFTDDQASRLAENTPEFTSEQIMQGIGQAISERKYDTVVALTRLLAVQDPEAAQSILDVVTLATAGAYR